MPLPSDPQHPANVGFRRSKTRNAKQTEALCALLRSFIQYEEKEPLRAELEFILQTIEKA